MQHHRRVLVPLVSLLFGLLIFLSRLPTATSNRKRSTNISSFSNYYDPIEEADDYDDEDVSFEASSSNVIPVEASISNDFPIEDGRRISNAIPVEDSLSTDSSVEDSSSNDSSIEVSTDSHPGRHALNEDSEGLSSSSSVAVAATKMPKQVKKKASKKKNKKTKKHPKSNTVSKKTTKKLSSRPTTTAPTRAPGDSFHHPSSAPSGSFFHIGLVPTKPKIPVGGTTHTAAVVAEKKKLAIIV